MNCPWHRDRLTILVIRGSIFGSSILNIVVGTGSNSQVLVLSDIMTWCTSFSSSTLNSCSFGVSVDVGVYTGLSLSDSLIFVIFSKKKLAKSSTRFSSEVCVGHCTGCCLVVRLFINVCIFFESFLHSANLILSVTFFLVLSLL